MFRPFFWQPLIRSSEGCEDAKWARAQCMQFRCRKDMSWDFASSYFVANNQCPPRLGGKHKQSLKPPLKILKCDCHEQWWDVLFEFFGAELMDTKSSWHNPRHLLTGDFWQLRVTLALHANGWHHQLYLFEQRGTFARRHPEAIERWFL